MLLKVGEQLLLLTEEGMLLHESRFLCGLQLRLRRRRQHLPEAIQTSKTINDHKQSQATGSN